MEQIFQIAVVLLGLIGIAVSYFIHCKKKHDSTDKMACPLDGSCKQVVTSRYSRFLGIDVEILGILYYSAIALAYTAFLLTPNIVPAIVTLGVIGTSMGALFFSIYLTFLQAFRLKMWCTWCLVSAFVCLSIMVAAVPASTVGISVAVSQYLGLILTAMLLATAAGFGVSLAYNSLVLNSLRDFDISENESKDLKLLNNLLWSLIIFVTVSMVSVVVAEPGILSQVEFQAAMFVLGFIVLNDAINTLYLVEEMAEAGYKDESSHDYACSVLMLGIASMYSWAFLFNLKVLSVSFSLYTIVSTYVIGLSVSLILALMVNRILKLRSGNELPDWSPLH